MSSEYEKTNIHLPTFLDGIDKLLPPSQKLFPYSLRQKIYVITDNLALGFTGSEYQIKLFLEDIKMYFKVKSSNTKNIKEFFNEYDFSNFDQSAFLAIYSEKTDKGILIENIIKGNWEESKSPTFEFVIAGGSGSQYFIDFSKKKYHTGVVGDKGLLYRAISLNYINLGNLLAIERLSLETIRKYWGAGFEMIYFNGERFEKMDNVTFIIWKGFVNLELEDYKIEPFLTMNYKYYDDVLFISASDFKTVEGYAVLSIDKRKEDLDKSKLPKKANFKSNKICCIYVLELSNGKLNTPAFFVESNSHPRTISIDFDSEGRLQVMIHKKTEQFLIENLKQLIKENKIK